MELSNPTYVQVPIKMLSAFASVNSVISVAKANTKANTMIAVVFLLMCVKNSRKTGISKIVTARQTAMIFATRDIFSLEKR
jgi:N-acyl-L-homoserine lactone synthetase